MTKQQIQTYLESVKTGLMSGKDNTNIEQEVISVVNACNELVDLVGSQAETIESMGETISAQAETIATLTEEIEALKSPIFEIPSTWNNREDITDEEMAEVGFTADVLAKMEAGKLWPIIKYADSWVLKSNASATMGYYVFGNPGDGDNYGCCCQLFKLEDLWQFLVKEV